MTTTPEHPDDAIGFTVTDRWAGHGMPGVDLWWHKAEDSHACAMCQAEGRPGPRKLTVTAVDTNRGTITIGSSIDE